MKPFTRLFFLTVIIPIVAAMMIHPLSASAQIFYKITSAGNDKTSYLLGTHHLAPVYVIDSIPGLPDALSSSDLLIGEIDISLLSDPSVMNNTMQAMTAPPDSTLDKVLSDAELDRVARTVARYNPNLIPQFLNSFKPSVIDNMLSQLISAKLTGEFMTDNIDTVMQTRATALSIPISSFETPEEQTALIYGTPVSDQARALMTTVDSLDYVETQIIALSEAYASRDMSAIHAAMLESLAEDPESYRQFVSDRNSAWLRRLLCELPINSLMIVVGAGHLPGQDGLIKGLRDAGYTVTAIY